MPNKDDRLMKTVRQILSVSQEFAEELKTQYIEPEFVLLAMTHLENNDAFTILNEFDIIATKLRPFLDITIFPEFEMMNTSHPIHSQLDLADETKTVLELSVEFARGFSIHYISSVSLLIGLMRLESDNIDKILAHFDVQRKDVIKLAKSYAVKHIYVENQKNEEDIDDVGCFAIIAKTLGLNESNKQNKK